MEEEKAWLDAELAGGGNAEEVDETPGDVNEDVVMDVAVDGDDNDTGIECQCCFADYPFVRAYLLSPFYLVLTSRSTVPNGSMPRSSPLLLDLYLNLRIHPTRLSQLLSDLYPLFFMFSTLPHFRTQTNPLSQIV
jgi:hypothetical protein